MELATEKRRQKYQKFVVSDVENSVEDFCRIYGGNIPQIVRIKEGEGKGGKSKDTPVKKNQTFFVHKVCREKRMIVDVMKRGKKYKRISVPFSHPARFCLVGSDNESPDYNMEQLLHNKTFPCDVIVSPRCHFRIKLAENKKMKDALVLRLQGTYEETYMLGNPITEATVTKLSNEVVQIPRGPTLNVVTGIEGFAGKWSTYLQWISKALPSHQTDSGNFDFTSYQDYNPNVVWSDSHPVLCNYVAVSGDFNQEDGHKYEDLQKPVKKRDDYEITWIPTKDNHLCDPKAESPPKITNNSKSKSESTSNLYDVGWDPVTGRALLNGELLNTSEGTTHPKLQKSSTTPRDYKPEVSKTTDRSQIQTIPSPEFPKSSILISDLPKPTPKKFSSLRRPDGEKPEGKKLHKLRKARSEDNDCGLICGQLCSNSNDFHSGEKAKQRALTLPTMSVSDISYWLKILKIKCVDKFVEQAIDGNLLMDLSDDILMSSDFGMSRTDVFKLRKFIKEGYVPKS